MPDAVKIEEVNGQRIRCAGIKRFRDRTAGGGNAVDDLDRLRTFAKIRLAHPGTGEAFDLFSSFDPSCLGVSVSWAMTKAANRPMDKTMADFMMVFRLCDRGMLLRMDVDLLYHPLAEVSGRRSFTNRAFQSFNLRCVDGTQARCASE